MQGAAKTNQFMLGTATVMIGAQADLMNLNPAEHSLGLVKNFSLNGEPQFTDLRQGVKNTIVFSTMTENTVRASCEVYEYTASNLAYGLQLNGGDYAAQTASGALASLVNGASSATDQVPLGAGEGANFSADDYIMIDAGDDNIVTRKISSISTDTLTVDSTIGVDLAAGSTVRKVNLLAVGSKKDAGYFSAKIVGRAANGEPLVILLPKVRITGGFTLQFAQDDYGNLPFEMATYDLVPADPHFADFGDKQAALLRS